MLSRVELCIAACGSYLAGGLFCSLKRYEQFGPKLSYLVVLPTLIGGHAVDKWLVLNG
ncbi:MAG TPA: hypothetical protein VM487_19620 [Phycisphaerae bacterium]|nr:hypothetical protein [Phycisphaerae bacterium]